MTYETEDEHSNRNIVWACQLDFGPHLKDGRLTLSYGLGDVTRSDGLNCVYLPITSSLRVD